VFFENEEMEKAMKINIIETINRSNKQAKVVERKEVPRF
jgi:hypothetical protein